MCEKCSPLIRNFRKPLDCLGAVAEEGIRGGRLRKCSSGRNGIVIDEVGMQTTLNKIREHRPCKEGWATLLKGLGKTSPDDEPLRMVMILEINGLDDAIWALRAVEGKEREMRLFAIGCAREVQHSMTDKRSLAALDVGERYANGLASVDELHAANAAAVDAAWSSRCEAAWAARAASRDSALVAASCAPLAARSAYGYGYGEWAIKEAVQVQLFRKMCES